MYYLLNKRYRLCGWERLPYALVDRISAKAEFIPAQEMDTLKLCSGKIDFSLPLVSQQMREIAARLEEEGIIRQCRPGEMPEEGQAYRLYPNRFMETVHWSVTGRCNCRCRHCYMSAPEARYGELSHKQVMKIIEDMGRCGVLRCSLTGGEALVREDFFDIVDALLAQGILITAVYSNGFLVNERLLDEFEKRKIRPEFSLSFDGAGFHDWLRGIDGAETAVRRAFSLCREHGFPTSAEMCLWKENADVLRESIDDLASAGCIGVKVNPVSDSGAWEKGGYSRNHTLSVRELYEIYFRYLESFYRDLPPLTVHLGGFFYADGSRPDRYHLPSVHVYGNPMRSSLCLHARNNMYISAEGRALTCMALSSMDDIQKDYPLVQEEGLMKCLSESKYLELINTRAEEVLSHNEKCGVCSYRKICLGGCRASALISHPGDLLAPDEMACEFYHDGWLDRVEKEIARLRPDAVFLERKQLKALGREAELSG